MSLLEKIVETGHKVRNGIERTLTYNIVTRSLTTLAVGSGFYLFADQCMEFPFPHNFLWAAIGVIGVDRGLNWAKNRIDNPDLVESYTTEKETVNKLVTFGLASLAISYMHSDKIEEIYEITNRIINDGFVLSEKYEVKAMKNLIGKSTITTFQIYMGYAILRLVGSMLSPKKLILLQGQLEGDLNRKIILYEEVCKENDSRDARLYLANAQMVADNQEDAMINATRALALPKLRYTNYLQVEDFWLSESVLKNKRILEEQIEQEAKVGINLALLYLFQGNIESTQTILEETEIRFPDDADLKLFYHCFLKEFGQPEKAKQKLTEAIAMFDLDQKGKILRFKGKYASHEYLLKTGEKEELTEEAKRAALLREEIGNDSFRVVNPVDIVKYKEFNVYVMTHEQGEMLCKLEQDQFYYFEKAAELTGLIHGILPFDPQPRDYFASLRQGIKTCPVFDEQTSNELIKIIQRILERKPIAIAVARDAHGENYIINLERQTITAIDFDNKGSGDVVFDATKLTEHTGYFKDKDRERLQVLKTYSESFNEHNRFGQRIDSFERFAQDHTLLTPITAISYFCFSYRLEDKEEMRTNYMFSALRSMARLRTDFIGIYNKGSDDFSRLTEILSKTPRTNKEIRRLIA